MISKHSVLIPTILCGGVGSRLWPVSRDAHPKPFIKLTDGRSMLQKAFARALALRDVAEILTVTNRELFFKTEDEYREVNAAGMTTSFILEPFGRNTAAAVATAAAYVQQQYGDTACLLVLAADHLITDQVAFEQAVVEAIELAAEGRLVTFGITPTSPQTGYGYIRARDNEVLSFVEKPNFERAQQYLAAGDYLWNSGMFCFQAGTVLAAMQEWCPEVAQTTAVCLQQARRATSLGVTQIELGQEGFAAVPEISIDYAVMEKATNVAVVPCNMGWNDIGSWNALGELGHSDAAGNRVDGDVLLHDVTNCYIQSDYRLVGAVGVTNLVIVDTADALLVADKDCAQDVKHLYAELKQRGHAAHKLHNTVHRPWGTYTVLEEGADFKIKRIVVKPGAALSLQLHHRRSEHWIVVSGTAVVRNGDREGIFTRNQSTYIPAGNPHRLSNREATDLVLIEVQSGDYLGEDDIVRLEDIYGRA